MNRLVRLFGAAIAMSAALCWSLPSHALVVSIDQFTVTRDASAFFSDSFSDGVPPPSAPNYASGAAANYSVTGSIAAGAEALGRLQIDSANGALTSNAVDAARLNVHVLLNTSTTGGATQLGVGNTLVQTAVFGLVTPAGPAFSAYGIQFTDTANGATHQLAQLFVRYNETTARAEVAYILQDFDANTITTLGSTALAAPAGADQIVLTMSRPSAANDNFFGSFSYLAAGAVVGSGSFANAAALFQGEDFVRARFFVAQAVPEPGTSALMSLGALALLCIRRRRVSRLR